MVLIKVRKAKQCTEKQQIFFRNKEKSFSMPPDIHNLIWQRMSNNLTTDMGKNGGNMRAVRIPWTEEVSSEKILNKMATIRTLMSR